MSSVTIIDYGMGNLLSVSRAFAHCGAQPVLTATPEGIRAAERLVLPGVGAFADGMAGLRERGLIDPIREHAAGGKTFLGICLGMQMMLDSSEEFGSHAGLGLIPGRVVAIPPTGVDGKPHKIPHIGWNGLVPSSVATAWNGTVLEGIRPGAAAYFVHSFTAVPVDPAHRLADCLYNGRVIAAVIRAGEVYGCQFHPEKSGEVGLDIVRDFLRRQGS